MAKVLILFLGFALTPWVHALDCLIEAQEVVHERASQALSINKSRLKIRYVGGESRDGDTTSGGEYLSPSWEYFDVFLVENDFQSSKALGLYLIGVHDYSDHGTGETLRCKTYDLQSIPEEEWSEIYDIYL